mmetsp:Transcript_40206/g.126536  ORF Transcript_40206/g.126536 Transcript_40206/m.126536 type:complete len:379 (-) Transcript_40206:901-2037(-)
MVQYLCVSCESLAISRTVCLLLLLLLFLLLLEEVPGDDKVLPPLRPPMAHPKAPFPAAKQRPASVAGSSGSGSRKPGMRRGAEKVEIGTSHYTEREVWIRAVLKRRKRRLQGSLTNSIRWGDFIVIECRMLDGSPVTVRGQHPQARRESHVRFVLKKMGWDTMSAVIAICSSMRACGVRVSPSQLSYAGVKDKNALTFQEVTLEGVKKEEVERSAGRLEHGLNMSNIEYCDEPIALGQLHGNLFHVVIRNVTDRRTMQKQARRMKSKGFINYFGLQRFGTGSVPSAEVGKWIILREWEKAVEVIMDPATAKDPGERRAKVKYKENGNAGIALSRMPPFAKSETAILREVKSKGAERRGGRREMRSSRRRERKKRVSGL